MLFITDYTVVSMHVNRREAISFIQLVVYLDYQVKEYSSLLWDSCDLGIILSVSPIKMLRYLGILLQYQHYKSFIRAQ